MRPLHSSLKDLGIQISEAAKRTKEASDLSGPGYQVLFFIDDLLSEYRGAAATKTPEHLCPPAGTGGYPL